MTGAIRRRARTVRAAELVRNVQSVNPLSRWLS